MLDSSHNPSLHPNTQNSGCFPALFCLLIAENFLYMLDSNGSPSYRPNPRLARALEIMFILHQEHEMNCSTAAARHLASR
jgi:citrate synthase